MSIDSHRMSLLILLFLPSFVPLLYAFAGYQGHDFLFHATSWLELHQAWTAHEWKLGWAHKAQFGLGEPRFCFYPPLSVWIGTIFSFLVPFRWLPGFMAWLVLAAGGVAMYSASGGFVEKKYRFAAAACYELNAYALMNVMVRFAMAEAWVNALLPLLFLAFYKAVFQAGTRALYVLAGLLGACWLLNIPQSVVLFYGFGFAACAGSVLYRSLAPLVRFGFVEAGALGLSAFRLLPAWNEKAFIHSQAIMLYQVRDSMQFRLHVPNRTFIFSMGLLSLGMLCLSGPAFRALVRSSSGNRIFVISLAAIVLLALTLQIPPAVPLGGICLNFSM